MVCASIDHQLSRSINAMLDSIVDLAEEKDGSGAQADSSALARLAELNAMLSTAATRLEKLEDRATQLRNGLFEAMLEQSSGESSSSSESESGSEDEGKVDTHALSQPQQQDSTDTAKAKVSSSSSSSASPSGQVSLSELRQVAEASLVEILSLPAAVRPSDVVYSALAQKLRSDAASVAGMGTRNQQAD
jgi:hypothetical protein